jgi:serine/threonine protein kinase
MQRELQILHKLDHPNVIKLYGKIFHNNQEIYSMVFPWMEGGDLKHYLLEKRKDMSLNLRLDIVRASLWGGMCTECCSI